MVTIDEGSPLNEYETYAPAEKTGYNFAGWATEPGINVNAYANKDGELKEKLEGKLFDFNTRITEDMDAYPIWIRDRLEVILDGNGDENTPVAWGTGYDGKEQSSSFFVNIDERIDMTGLNSTTRTGYELEGWYTSGGVKWDGSYGVTPEYCDKDDDGNPVIESEAERRFNYYTVTLQARWTPKKIKVVYEPGE